MSALNETILRHRAAGIARGDAASIGDSWDQTVAVLRRCGKAK